MAAKKPVTPGVRLIVDNFDLLKRDIQLLADSEVLVGFPEETTDRDDGSPLNNASRGYIHDNGAPEANIPARPFMVPGIERAEQQITHRLMVTAYSVLKNSQQAQPKDNIVERGLHATGLVAVAAIKSVISDGIQPPLSDYTLYQRMRRVPSRTAEKKELANRAAGAAPSTDLVKPLIDTGEMSNAITHVLRSKRDRKDT